MAIAGTNSEKAGAAGDSIDISAPDFADFRSNSTLSARISATSFSSKAWRAAMK